MRVIYSVLGSSGYKKVGVFELSADGKSVSYTRVGETEPISEDAFLMSFGNRYLLDSGAVYLKKDPEAWLRGLPNRFRGYSKAEIVE